MHRTKYKGYRTKDKGRSHDDHAPLSCLDFAAGSGGFHRALVQRHHLTLLGAGIGRERTDQAVIGKLFHHMC
ncbi:MAG: hypothetical protein Alpg2KO_13950 [Alphaproteobacteria bacterium]